MLFKDLKGFIDPGVEININVFDNDGDLLEFSYHGSVNDINPHDTETVKRISIKNNRLVIDLLAKELLNDSKK